MIISSRILLRIRMFWTKIVGKTKTRILFLITYFSENRVVYEITWKNVEPDRPQVTI